MGSMILRPVIVVTFKKVKKLQKKKTGSRRKKANKVITEVNKWKKSRNGNTKR